MKKETLRTIWGIYGILAIAGTVGSYVWVRRLQKRAVKAFEDA